MCRPDYFAVEVRDQPVDASRQAGADRDLASGSGRRSRALRGARAHGSASSTRSRACPTWCSPPTAPGRRRPRLRRAVPPPAARRRGAGLPEWFTEHGFAGRRARVTQRGRGRLPHARRPGAGRDRLPHRTGRAPGGAGVPRPPGDHAAAGRPALLPPGHGAVPAATGATSPTTRGLLPGSREVLRRLFPDAVHRDRGRRRGARASTRSATASTW